MRFRFSDILLFALLFVFVAAFPYDLLPLDIVYLYLVRIGLRLLIIAYYVYIIFKYKIKIFGVTNFINLLLCLPFFIVSISNFTASWLFGGFNGVSMSPAVMTLSTVLTLLTAISEEIVFRLFIHNNLNVSSSFRRIVASAAIFALMHLLNLVNVSSLPALITVLVQTVYTFGLGLLLGTTYEYSHSLVGCMALHFVFNFFNSTLYLYFGGYCSDLAFYLTAVTFGVVVAIYGVLITIFYFQKYDRYFRQ